MLSRQKRLSASGGPVGELTRVVNRTVSTSTVTFSIWGTTVRSCLMAAKANVLPTTSMTSSYSYTSGFESEKPASPHVTAT